ncbi:MAG: 3-hydroxyacyl-CoA dehydrogenase/enoyl-CoA hydratase family protein [Chloroflexi bacterium]|nr:MAG: 3-hydroxyacyl-CoA dehydrogenase/enoyl-CoA hydratase family protein [Chloroflexota bacterium]
MTHNIRKAAVIGSGTMGGGIAALLAGVGIETLLLDIPAPGTSADDEFTTRNAIVLGNVERLKKSRPASLFHSADLDLITVGNTEDDLEKVAEADWVVEVVIEKLDVKQALMARLAEVLKPGAIVSTNTSGLPLQNIAEGLGDDFTRRFIGTHFFNPPRYLHLLEVIPHSNTAPEVIEAITEFGTRVLGKGVVICKDRPNFIGNRLFSLTSSFTTNYALDHGFTVAEVDNLTGPLIGRPKTATFRLFDLVGIDVAGHVSENLYHLIPDDEARDVLIHEGAAQMFKNIVERGWLGNKSGQGFYKRVDTEAGREFWTLNLETYEYEAPTKPRFDSVGKHRKVEDVGERIKLLINEDDRAAQFLWHIHAFYLAYASNRIPEIADTLVSIDNAMKWGFSHQLGPFEIWDVIGVQETISAFNDAGYRVADWVLDMVEGGHPTFYQYDDSGLKIGYYDPVKGEYIPLEDNPREITVEALRAGKITIAVSPDAGVPDVVTDNLRRTSSGVLASNSSAAILDMGDGVGLYEFHSKQNSIDGDTVAMGFRAVEMLEKGDLEALVIGNDGERFSIGFNIMLAVMAVQGGELGQLEDGIKQLQALTQALRYASRPVVTAPFNMALGGGAELAMAGVQTVAHAELYIGLVEVGVGVIPAGGGCKELLRRVVNPVMRDPHGDALVPLRQVFETIATAKVSTSAKEARELGFLSDNDRIVMNRSHLLGEAKRVALHLADGYTPMRPGKVWAAGRDAHAALLLGIQGFVEGGYATEYDAHIARKLAYVLTGGAVTEPQWVDEQVILNLEREAFMSLVKEEKTMARIQHMLQTNKPLRN